MLCPVNIVEVRGKLKKTLKDISSGKWLRSTFQLYIIKKYSWTIKKSAILLETR